MKEAADHLEGGRDYTMNESGGINRTTQGHTVNLGKAAGAIGSLLSKTGLRLTSTDLARNTD
jgi:hypothetical protein